MLDISIIIPTYNRPEELQNCLASILEQTVLPGELIIVDDGNLEQIPLAGKLAKASIKVLYHKKDTPGLTASRNVGIGLATGGIIFFLDDDVVLYPHYTEKILALFGDDPSHEIGGVGGLIANTKPFTLKRKLFHHLERLFLLSGKIEGRVLPSGFCVDYGETGNQIDEIVEVDFLPGGVSAYRKQVFESFSFSEDFIGYGQGEDKDFSFRVAQKYKLLIAPEAKLLHLESPKMRFDKFTKGQEYVLGRYKFFEDYLGSQGKSWFPFYYAIFGYLLKRLLILLMSFDKSEFARILGVLAAIKKMHQLPR